MQQEFWPGYLFDERIRVKQDAIESSDEPGLIALAQRGDEEAFRYLVRFYEPPLAAYLARMLSDQESARDLLQETLLAAYRALPRWQPPAASRPATEADEPGAEQRYLAQHPLAPWLYRIATNLALNFLKSRSRAMNMAPFALQASRAELAGPHRSMLDLDERFVTRELLREALSHLSREDAACLLLRFVEGERYAEIAARLGISAEAARKRVGRGLTTLRSMYWQLDKEVS